MWLFLCSAVCAIWFIVACRFLRGSRHARIEFRSFISYMIFASHSRIHTAKEAADKSNQHCWCAAIHLTLFNNVTTRRRLIYWSSLAIACNHSVLYTGARISWEISCVFGLATGKHCNMLDMLKRAMTRCIHPGRSTPSVWLLFSTIPTVLHSTRLRLSLLLLFAGSMQTAHKIEWIVSL